MGLVFFLLLKGAKHGETGCEHELGLDFPLLVRHMNQ